MVQVEQRHNPGSYGCATLDPTFTQGLHRLVYLAHLTDRYPLPTTTPPPYLRGGHRGRMDASRVLSCVFSSQRVEQIASPGLFLKLNVTPRAAQTVPSDADTPPAVAVEPTPP